MASHFTLQEMSRPGAAGSERILLDILEHDWREAQDSRQELCQKLHAVQGELQWAEELRDKVGPTPASPPASDPPTSTKGPGLGLPGMEGIPSSLPLVPLAGPGLIHPH